MKRYFTKTKESNILVPAKSFLGGWFRFTAIRPDGRKRPLTDWFPNLITDAGLNRMGTGAWITHCHVGSGSAEPQVTDSQLQTFVASTGSLEGASIAAQSSPPYFGSTTFRYRFGAGAAAGNLSEVGVGWGGTSSGPLYSRALILDANEEPTTITVLSDEVLDVEYQLRLYPPTEDVISQITDDGPDGTEHTVITRASQVNSTLRWPPASGSPLTGAVRPTSELMSVYNGDIGPVTGLPSGSLSNINSAWAQTYSNNSLERLFGVSAGLNQGNVSGGIRSTVWRSEHAGAYQVQFGPPIPKDNTKVLSLQFKFSWGRYDPE